jgi:hypothetical protein
MRIYINNFNLDILNDISDLFKEHITNSETYTYIELYTSQGIYRIEEKNIYFLDTCDKDIKIVENYYNNLTLIVDLSFFQKQCCSTIHGENHLALQITEKQYKINPSSEINIVIKYIFNEHEDKLIPNDIYFETEKDININEIFIKKEIIEFLLMLN